MFELRGQRGGRMATARRRTAGALDGAGAKVKSSLWTGALRFEVYEENSGRTAGD
jgi:hypothetical protein